MSRNISRAEAWERAHEIFTQVNFNSFDFNTIKESLLDYTKIYFPEDFNDYIESSEFIAVLELFAYVGEILAYRIDLNAHENFITSAQRKESILRLATLISYKASRNIPARGLVKLTSIQTTETIVDSQGRNIANRRILWNDGNNNDWKEQFLLIMNRILEQPFGTVSPSERIQIDDVLFELYTLNNSPISTTGPSVFKYSASVNGTNYPMEITPVSLYETGPEEKRPERKAKMSLLYGSDGLGDGSDTTGFFMYTKQGDLQLQELNFDGVTPNQTFDIEIPNINQTDLWLNNVDPNNRTILEQDPYAKILPHLVSADLRYGEWVEVDLGNAQNIMFNTNRNRHKYEVESLDNDKIRMVFGDGEFSDIPSGAFDLWYRTSANENVAIPKSTVVDESASFSYVDALGVVQTITITFSLISSLQNASSSEDIEHIRRVAPSVYYTQDRMVNGRDYNTFMLQDPSILKMRSINRTFAGDSKYIAWHDPKEYYEDVKIFGDDLALYWDEKDPTTGGLITISKALTVNEVLTNYIEPLLCSTDFFAVISPELEIIGANPADIRCTFNVSPYSFDENSNEVLAITEALNVATTTTPIVDLYYSVIYDEWTVSAHPCDSGTGTGCTKGAADSIWMIQVEARFSGSNLSGWDIRWITKRMISHSQTTKFWNTTTSNRIMNFDTLNSNPDLIVVLQANANADGTGLISNNRNFGILGQELVEQNLPNAGLPDDHSLSVLPVDINDDNIPDNLAQEDLFDANYTSTYGQWKLNDPADAGTYVIQFPNNKNIIRQELDKIDKDIDVYLNGVKLSFSNASPTLKFAISSGTDIILDRLQIDVGVPLNDSDEIKLVFVDYVYFQRESSIDPWKPVPSSVSVKTLWALDTTTITDERRYKRHNGRYPLNFAWMHSTPRFHLIDPAASNLIDTFIITQGYYASLRRYLENKTDIVPVEPTPLELRTSYAELLENKMISDTVILHSGKFKILFGSRAVPELRALFKVIRPINNNLTDNEIKVRVVSVIRTFFDVNNWEFGETFYFTELASSIHADLGPEIDSIVIVPTYSQNQFGDMFEVQAREDEMFIPDINTSDIQIVQSYTPENIRQNSE